MDELRALPPLQLEILRSAAQALKPGGTLIYSTCTLEREENEGVITQFNNIHDNFKLEYIKILLPHVDGTDGFFIAKLKKS